MIPTRRLIAFAEQGHPAAVASFGHPSLKRVSQGGVDMPDTAWHNAGVVSCYPGTSSQGLPNASSIRRETIMPMAQFRKKRVQEEYLRTDFNASRWCRISRPAETIVSVLKCSVFIARRLLGSVAVSMALAITCGSLAADWPAYRHDLARSGVTEETLATPLHRQWRHASRHAPRPAWPEPGRELNRLAFDHAYEVVAAEGLAFFGSSADHKVYALDLATGQTRWSFFTEGPVRFAPAIERGRVFVASDDGCLYCLSAADGRLLWRFRGGLRNERIIGNGQLISRWPLRTGVAVESGLVYFTAGMWPNEGVWLYALKANDGQIVWQNQTSGSDYIAQPHPPACAVSGVAPQGYLLGHPGQLFVPTGRNVAAAFDREKGDLVYYNSRPTTWGDRWGGSWHMLAEGLLFGWRCHVGPDIDVQLGEYAPDKNDGMVAFDAQTGSVRRDFPGKLCTVAHGGNLYASGSGSVTAYDFTAWAGGAKVQDCTRWETPHGRTYAMILAGNLLVTGGQDTVTAIDTQNGRAVWEDKLDGQARSLAVADGRLLVSTTAGTIFCYGAQPQQQSSAESPSEEAARLTKNEPEAAAADLAEAILQRSGKRAGYCLAVGAGDGRLLAELARRSELNIACVEPDAAKVASSRQALDAAGWHGVRVTVQQGTLGNPVYPDYFADLVVLPDAAAEDDELSVAEVYRVLRPHGGTACFARGGSADRADRIRRRLAEAKIPAGEVSVDGDWVQVTRAALPGEGDWTHQYADAAKSGCSPDQRVRLPLKLLWFGEPGPEWLISRHWKGPAPLCVAGRMFIAGQRSLMAVDAYNGRLLWRRDLPKVGRYPVTTTGSNIAADDQNVYLVVDDACLRLDAESGETVQTYPLPPNAEAPAKKGGSPRTWSYLAVSPRGVLGGEGSQQASDRLFLLDRDGALRWTYTAAATISNNAVCLVGDLVCLIDATTPQSISRAKQRGEPLDATWRLVALNADTGQPVWETEEAISGRTELWSSQGVLLATGGNGMTGYEAATGKLLYDRPVRMARFPVLVGDTIYGEPMAYDLATGDAKRRKNPFTDAEVAWDFSRSYGCGSISAAPNLLMFRSGTLGMYDLADDTGVHNFGGVRAGCHVNAIAAGGLLLMPPADAACTCSYCYQTTVALAPAGRQENWSVFYNRLPTTSVKQVALNLGAPGDQRDAEGKLWLAAPRPKTPAARTDIAVPFRFDSSEGFGTYRVNADAVPVAGSDCPWIYTSGLNGPLRAELDLEILDQGISAWPVDGAPSVDGSADEPCWDGYKAIALDGGASVTLRHDAENLYLAYKKPASASTPWKKSTAGDDAPVWKDDAFELYLAPLPKDRDKPSQSCFHLGVSASGARYDALWHYVTPALPRCDIPRLDVSVDGDATDWGDRGLRVTSLPGPDGKLRAASDLDAGLRIGWNERGLLLLAEVNDNSVRQAPSLATLDQADCIELLLTRERGSDEGYRLVAAPGTDPTQSTARTHFTDYRKDKRTELSVDAAARKTPRGYQIELCLPWSNLGAEPQLGREFGLQILVNDDDGRGEKYRFQALWHPAGDPRKDPLAYQVFRLAEKPSEAITFHRAAKADSSGLYAAVPPHPFPVPLPPLGAEGERAEYAGAWSSAVHADEHQFSAELAIPWKTLAMAGLAQNDTMIRVGGRAPIAAPPQLGKGFERLIAVPPEEAQERSLSVRLHFAELDAAAPGQRVFDVKLQNKVVLKDFDIVREAGAARRALVKQFDGIVAARALVVELVPHAKTPAAATSPVLSGIEILSP